MTGKEAKKWLNKLYARADITDEYGDMEDMQPYSEAVDMAIEALEAQPCEDAISRQATLEPYKILDDTDTLCVALIRANIMQQPPVTPQQKVGRWIEKEDYNLDTYYDCSVCGESWTTIDGTPWDNGMNYCPNCGAKMEEVGG